MLVVWWPMSLVINSEMSEAPESNPWAFQPNMVKGQTLYQAGTEQRGHQGAIQESCERFRQVALAEH